DRLECRSPRRSDRRHARGRAHRSRPAHGRQRQGRDLPGAELLPLRHTTRARVQLRRRLRGLGPLRAARRSRTRLARRLPTHSPVRQLLSAKGGPSMNRPRHAHTRRHFLRGAGGAMLALPFLDSLLPRGATAQASTAPKRFIVLKTFSTQLVKKWYPSFEGNGYVLKDEVYRGSKADGTTLLTERIDGGPYTW